MATFRAAVLQMRSSREPEANVAALEAMVGEAAEAGARYVQTPEMTGMLQRDRAELMKRLKREEDDLVATAAAQLARRHGIYLHIGSTAIALDDGRIANRALLFAPDGTKVARYDKIHMFDVDLDDGESWRESRTYRPGGCARLADLAFPDGTARLGFGICYDLRFPQLFREEAVAGAEVLTAPAAFTRQTGEAHWHVLARARAIENGAYLVAAAQGGRHEDGRETFGHSLIVDPWGRVIAEVDGDAPGIALATIDTSEVAKARRQIPNLKNARPFAIGDEDGGRVAVTGAAEAAE